MKTELVPPGRMASLNGKIIRYNRHQEMRAIKNIIIHSILCLMAAMFVQANTSQKFVPNGRYGRRSDLPALAPLSSQAAQTSTASISAGSMSRASATKNLPKDLFVNQDGETLNVKNDDYSYNKNDAYLLSNDDDWTLNLKQRWCDSIEDKALMIQCYKSFPIMKFIIMRNNHRQHRRRRQLSTTMANNDQTYFNAP